MKNSVIKILRFIKLTRPSNAALLKYTRNIKLNKSTMKTILITLQTAGVMKYENDKYILA